MKEVIDTLNQQPEIGIASTIGSASLYWMDIMNPILSFMTLFVGLMIGLVTLAIKIREWKNGS
jgi:hypothetical protein